MTELLYQLFSLETILVGFGSYSILFVIILDRINPTRKNYLLQLDPIASIIYSIAGLITIGMSMVSLIEFNSSLDDPLNHYPNPLFGPYWYQYWLQPTITLLCTQLIWIPAIRSSKIARVIIGVLTIIPFFLLFMMYPIHEQQDYLPSARIEVSILEILLGALIHGIIFTAFVSGFLYLIKKYKALTK